MNRLTAFLFCVVIVVCAGGYEAWAGNRQNRALRTSRSTVNTRVRHIIWVWFENREASEITYETAPFFTSFAEENANLTNFFSMTHPSQPDYLDAFSGSDQGITDDDYHSIAASADNLAKQLSRAGRSWRVYAQNFPGGCFDGDESYGGDIDGPGLPGVYVRRHNPAIQFENIRLDPTECANIQPLANFDPTVDFAMVIPNLTNDMHDGTTADGDAFLEEFVPMVTDSPDWAHTLLIVTFDEGSTELYGGGHIYTAAMAPWLGPASITEPYDHFSVLRTIEDVYGLPFLDNAGEAATITELLPWQPAVAFDYDGDGITDISIFRPATGEWYLQGSQAGLFGTPFGLSDDEITPADFDGDLKTDIAVYRPSTGIWYVLNSSDGTVSYFNFGIAEDLPTPADYDGDGLADISVFRPSDGTWYRQNSYDGSFSAIQFGVSGDKPTMGDFDGDGKADIGVFRPSVGAWYQINSSDDSISGEQFGFGSDVIVPADYDGDGKTDLAVFRPSNGFWYVKRSATGTYTAFPFGLSSDIPAPGDFDGDAKADLSVFRPSDGTWYIMNSSNGSFNAHRFGSNGDKPTQTAFIH